MNQNSEEAGVGASACRGTYKQSTNQYVFVKNNTEKTIPSGSPVGFKKMAAKLPVKANDTLFMNGNYYFEAVFPVDLDDKDLTIGIAEKGLAQGQLAEILIYGVTQVRCSVKAKTDPAIKLNADGNGFETAATGFAEVIWKSEETGNDQYAVISLGLGSRAAYNGMFLVIPDPDYEGEGVASHFWVVNGADSDYDKEGYLCGKMDVYRKGVEILRGEIKADKNIYLTATAKDMDDGTAKYTIAVTTDEEALRAPNTGSVLLAYIDEDKKITQVWKSGWIYMGDRYYIVSEYREPVIP